MLGRVYARIAAIGASLNQKSLEKERVTTSSVGVQSAAKTSVPESAGLKKVIDAKNLKHHITHLFDCPYWTVPSQTKTKEALKVCNCGVAEFDVDKFIKDTVAMKVLERTKTVCGQCKSGAQKYHASEGFYHKSGEEIDDYCDASPLWVWLMDMGYLKVKEDA
jgi:hypothetical protein